jgi:hypothetical protein
MCLDAGIVIPAFNATTDNVIKIKIRRNKTNINKDSVAVNHLKNM